MPQLYNDQTEKEIRGRFIQKCDDLIAAGRASTYKDICERIDISTASFNQVKSGKGMPTIKMLYNLQAVYKLSCEEVLFKTPPRTDVPAIARQLEQHLQACQDIIKQELQLI